MVALPRVGSKDVHQDFDGGGFARTIGADQGIGAAAGHGEAQAA